jgi:hypothetical protein
MRKIPLVMALSLVLIFGLAWQASAFNVIYLGTDPNYVITSVSGNDVQEDYNATQLIPYPSHDGFAVVDLDLTGAPIYFDKAMVFDAKDLKNNFTITWNISNTSPYTWSDFHFIMEDEGQIINNASSADFKGVTITGNTEIDYYYDPPGGKLVAPGDTLQLIFSLDTTGLTGTDIEFRQIATAVPIPAALPLLGTGILGLFCMGRRKARP